MKKIKEWLKRRWQELSIVDPNSPEGLRERAIRLVQDGTPEDNPWVTSLLKQADVKEGIRITKPNGEPLTPKEYIALLKSKGFTFQKEEKK